MHLLVVAAEPILAGQFLSGADHAVVFHEAAGQLAAALGLTQVIVLVIARAKNQSFVAFLVSSILILMAEALQIGTGYGRFLGVHIPLGVLIFGGLAAQLAWSLR